MILHKQLVRAIGVITSSPYKQALQEQQQMGSKPKYMGLSKSKKYSGQTKDNTGQEAKSEHIIK